MMRRTDVLYLEVCPAMQIGLSDKNVIYGNSSLSGPGPPSKFFQAVTREVKSFPESPRS